MPLVINAFGDGHTHIPMHEPKQFQKTRRAPACGWCIPGLENINMRPSQNPSAKIYRATLTLCLWSAVFYQIWHKLSYPIICHNVLQNFTVDVLSKVCAAVSTEHLVTLVRC